MAKSARASLHLPAPRALAASGASATYLGITPRRPEGASDHPHMEGDEMTKPVCAIVGIGPGNGAALARRFAADHRLALLSRSTDLAGKLAAEIGDARAYACDVTEAQAIDSAFDTIAAELGAVDTLVYNAGSGVLPPSRTSRPLSSKPRGGSTPTVSCSPPAR
jgi:hypothetical protein